MLSWHCVQKRCDAQLTEEVLLVSPYTSTSKMPKTRAQYPKTKSIGRRNLRRPRSRGEEQVLSKNFPVFEGILPINRPFWDPFGTLLAPFWHHFGTILGSFGTLLAPFWHRFGNSFGTILGPFWHHFGKDSPRPPKAPRLPNKEAPFHGSPRHSEQNAQRHHDGSPKKPQVSCRITTKKACATAASTILRFVILQLQL